MQYIIHFGFLILSKKGFLPVQEMYDLCTDGKDDDRGYQFGHEIVFEADIRVTF